MSLVEGSRESTPHQLYNEGNMVSLYNPQNRGGEGKYNHRNMRPLPRSVFIYLNKNNYVLKVSHFLVFVPREPEGLLSSLLLQLHCFLISLIKVSLSLAM